MKRESILLFQRQFSKHRWVFSSIIVSIYVILTETVSGISAEDMKLLDESYHAFEPFMEMFIKEADEIDTLIQVLLNTDLKSNTKHVSYSFSTGRLVELIHGFNILVNKVEETIQRVMDILGFDFKPLIDKWVKEDIQRLELEHQINGQSLDHLWNDARGVARKQLLKRKAIHEEWLRLKESKKKSTLLATDRLVLYSQAKYRYKTLKTFLTDLCRVYLYEREDWDASILPFYLQRPYYNNPDDKRFETSEFMKYYYQGLPTIQVENKEVTVMAPALNHLSKTEPQVAMPIYPGPENGDHYLTPAWFPHTHRKAVTMNVPRGIAIGGTLKRKSRTSRKHRVRFHTSIL